MAFHLIRKGISNSTNLGQTFSVNKDGRVTFAKEMVAAIGLKEGDKLSVLWNDWDDKDKTPTLSFKIVDRNFVDGFTFHSRTSSRSALVSIKQLRDKVTPGRYSYLGMCGDFILTDCPYKV